MSGQFRPWHANSIRSGRRVQIRFPVRPSHRRCPMTVGHSYAFEPYAPGSGRDAGRVKILAVDRHSLWTTTAKDAKREGFPSLRDYFDYWLERHGDVALNPSVWAVAFVVDPDPVRLLHRDSTHGYTANRFQAVDDEPEAVDEATQARFAEEVRARDAKVRQDRARSDQVASNRRRLDKLTERRETRGPLNGFRRAA